MTDREKIAHLLRRFGFGANKWELDAYSALGVDGAIAKLIEYEKTDEGFSISPWEVCYEEGKDEVYVDPYRFSGWWGVRMLMSQRPLEQKLTLFWHDHFAVGADKVEFGPMMLSYIETIRKDASGDFAVLLKAVSKEPAMLRYLDADSSFKDHPNENFARELLELFTVGIGNFTEKDMHEASRAFTGWGNRYVIYESGGEKVQERIKDCIKRDIPMVAFAISPELHDDGPKTVLGTTERYDGDMLLDALAKRSETARLITGKLWDFFAYSNAPPTVRDRLAETFAKSNGNTREVLREMVKCPEFWSEECVLKQVKSPADFIVGATRAMNLIAILQGMHTKTATNTTPLAKPLRDSGGLIIGSMFKQGMLLLFPPNVGGWEWGTAWISSTNMVERMHYADTIMGIGQADHPLAAYLGQLVVAQKPQSDSEAVGILLSIFDGVIGATKKDILTQAFTKGGGVASLSAGPAAATSLSAVLRLLFGSPEFQFC